MAQQQQPRSIVRAPPPSLINLRTIFTSHTVSAAQRSKFIQNAVELVHSLCNNDLAAYNRMRKLLMLQPVDSCSYDVPDLFTHQVKCIKDGHNFVYKLAVIFSFMYSDSNVFAKYMFLGEQHSIAFDQFIKLLHHTSEYFICGLKSDGSALTAEDSITCRKTGTWVWFMVLQFGVY
jgi:hypothetical protein